MKDDIINGGLEWGEMSMQELLDPRVDVIFKRIFGSEHNKDVRSR